METLRLVLQNLYIMEQLVAGAFLQSSFQVIFEKLASLDISEYFSSNNVDELVKKLHTALDSINKVLDEAEIKQYQRPHVKKWLDELKHVIYEADQILDEIDTDATLNKLKAESEPVTTSVLGFFSALITNPVESRIKEQLEKLEHLAKQKKELGLGEGPCASNEGLVSLKPSKRLSSTSLVDESGIYGRDVDTEELIKFLLEGNDNGNQVPIISKQVPIISIVGLGGMGKTTLAQLVYNDDRIKENFVLRAWVYVSESFDDVGFTKAILKSFKFPADGEYLNLLQDQLQHVLKGKKYLLVLDDIWNGNAEYWELLLRPFNHGSSGSKIIVTTREKEVADHVLKSTKLFDLQQLDKSNCWSLFVRHAFHGKNVYETPQLESIGKKIVDKCGGLPLAIKSLGQLLRIFFSQNEWLQILETDMWSLSDGEDTINSVLRLSYHNLPSNLKRCFAYCSIFPKSCRFKKDKLIKLWMAEGLLMCGGSHESEEEVGNGIFGYLESISFFQQSFDIFDRFFGDGIYVMHDLVNDVAKSVSGEFCRQIEGARVEGTIERTHHIRCYVRSNCVDKLIELICEVQGLRSLILEDSMILQGNKAMLIRNIVQHDLFSRLKCLRMLSFKGCHLSEVVDEISNLKLLRYLDLSYTEITSLPDSICMLYNLQTLLLQGCYQLTDLPSNFSKLVNLRHLELPYQTKIPKHVGKLENLQALPSFNVEKHKGYDLKELEKLNHLHGEIHIKGLDNVIDPADAVTANLKDKKNLEELHMEFDGGREEMDDSIIKSNMSVLEALQPNRNLKRLTISKYKGDSFPNWIIHLPNLVSLQLQDCKGVKIIGKDFYGNNSKIVPFRSLEVLKFQRMDNWEEWSCLEGFPLLKELSISECPKLKRALPQYIPSLQKLSICACDKLEASLPKADNVIELVLVKILVNELPISLKTLILRENRYTERSLINFTFLEELDLDFTGIVECHSLNLHCYDSLRELSIKGWCSSSLPLELHMFTNLYSLKFFNCPELESFPRGGFPSNLWELVIWNCPKLIGSREEWGLFQLNSLYEFTVSDEFENVESFPEENLLPPTLVSLWLYDCSKLRKMNNKGFLHLKSLKYLHTYDCPSLESLPEKGLPSSLDSLWIADCPLIKQQYEKEKGERWHTICHIPSVIFLH